MLCWLHIDSLHRQSGPFLNGRTHIGSGTWKNSELILLCKLEDLKKLYFTCTQVPSSSGLGSMREPWKIDCLTDHVSKERFYYI